MTRGVEPVIHRVGEAACRAHPLPQSAKSSDTSTRKPGSTSPPSIS
jgi:hypothetical protein